MKQKSDRALSEKRELLSFLETKYDIPRERLHDFVDISKLPEEIDDLSFVKRKMIYESDEDVGRLTDEFNARIEYLDEFLNLNFNHPPDTRDGYISQSEIKDEMAHRARENPSLVTNRLVDDREYEDLLGRLDEQLDFLEEELAECETTEELANQIRLPIALIRYSVESENSADIRNGFRVLKYLTCNHTISASRQQHAYSKIGNKLGIMFDEEETIPDKLYSYYGSNMMCLVNCTEKCLRESKD